MDFNFFEKMFNNPKVIKKIFEQLKPKLAELSNAVKPENLAPIYKKLAEKYPKLQNEGEQIFISVILSSKPEKSGAFIVSRNEFYYGDDGQILSKQKIKEVIQAEKVVELMIDTIEKTIVKIEDKTENITKLLEEQNPPAKKKSILHKFGG